jgi:hypothetical protein
MTILTGVGLEKWMSVKDMNHSRTLEVAEEAAERAIAAGAVGPLSILGSGNLAIVFRDEGFLTAWKVLYSPANPVHKKDLTSEHQWMCVARCSPEISQFVCPVYGFKRDIGVLQKELCFGDPLSQFPEMDSYREQVEPVMAAAGWGMPEWKPESFMKSINNIVLVDAGSARQL